MNVEGKVNKASGGWSAKRIIAAVILVAGILAAYLYGNNSSPSNSTNATSSESHSVGESFIFNGVEFNVSDVKKTSGAESDIITVTYSAKNNNKKEITIGSTNIKLIDGQDRVYESRLSIDAPGALNPGIKKNGKAEFEVPKDAAGLRVALRTDVVDLGGADYSYVRIP